VEAVAKTQRRRAHRTPADSSVVHVEMKDGMGSTRWVTANLVDVLSDGCGLALMNFLKSGSTVVVRGRLGADRAGNHLKAGVRWCVAKTDGTFRAGLEFLDSPSAFSQDEEQAESAVTQDCYEVMQLSPNADPDTISRVYRMLAFRYHPDNTATGNSEMFIRLADAYQMLSDPEKRACYDLRHRDAQQLRARTLGQASAAARREWEKRAGAYLGLTSPDCTVCWEG
jgi:hypothetical protein